MMKIFVGKVFAEKIFAEKNGENEKTRGPCVKAALRFFAALFALTVLWGNAAAWGAVTSADIAGINKLIAEEERKGRELAQKIAEYRKTADDMRRREDDVLRRIDSYKQSTERARQEIALLELQTDKLQKTIDILNRETGETEKKIRVLVTGLKQRMVDLSKYGTSEGLLAIFSSENTHEVLDSVHLLTKLAQHDQFLIEQLEFRKEEMIRSQRAAEDQRDTLKQQSQALTQERQKYNSALKQTNTFLNDIRRKKSLAEKTAKEMEEAQKAVGQTILTLMNQKKERDKQAGQKSGGGTTTDWLGGRIAQGRGSMFDWPVRGPISSPFGSRVHPVFKTKSFHSGLDISAPRGTPVKVAAPGEVLYVGWMRGYGQVVIVDHGRNYTTVYAHMSSTAVKEGARLTKPGTVVGAVGDTGTTTGYHLHFEVRTGSTAKSPLDYLKR